MTKEAKAKQLGVKHTSSFTTNGLETYHIGCYFACLEMAEWEKQEIIDKTIEFIKDKLSGILHTMTDKYIEDYKKYMEE